MSTAPAGGLLAPDQKRWWYALLLIGPFLLLLAATIFGVTEVHSSTDTYIGLAGGRAIYESTDGFPLNDTYSYTFNGKLWFNQNWLTHLWQYWMYKSFGPDAVVWGTWAMSALIFVFSFFAVWMRCGSAIGGLIAAAVVGFGCRDFISARPATTGFFAMSAFWMLICALEGQSQKRRWWPIIFMVPLLLAWGCAHGSFIFAYPMLAIYLVYWLMRWGWRSVFGERSWGAPLWLDAILLAVTIAVCCFVVLKIVPKKSGIDLPPLEIIRTWAVIGAIALGVLLMAAFVSDRGKPAAISANQAVGVAAILLLGFALTALLSPFGFANFFHVRDVAESAVWRTVSEWNPPYTKRSHFPPVMRFKLILGAAVATVVCAGILYAILRALASDPLRRSSGTDSRQRRSAGRRDARGRRRAEDRASVQRDDAQSGLELDAAPRAFSISAFDVLAVGIGLIMTFFARRFAPIFLIFAAPMVTVIVVNALRLLEPRTRPYLRLGLVGACWAAAAYLGDQAYTRIQKEIYHERFESRPNFGLLERVTRYDAFPNRGIQYLKRNEIRANVYAEWTISGALMFYAPTAKVFMDGRAQQVYSVKHYNRYRALMNTNTSNKQVSEILDQFGTDVVFLRASQTGLTLWRKIEPQRAKWKLMYLDEGRSGRSVMFIRAGSPVLQQIRALMDSGREWRPQTAEALMTRGYMWIHSSPSNPAAAVRDWIAAANQRPTVGEYCYLDLMTTLLANGQADQAERFTQRQEAQLRQLRTALPEKRRRNLEQLYRQGRKLIADTRAALSDRPNP